MQRPWGRRKHVTALGYTGELAAAWFGGGGEVGFSVAFLVVVLRAMGSH